jgi:hypothetical protein
MSEIEVPRRGFIGFLTTIPGILTALAGLLTAAGGVYVATHDSKSGSPESKPVVVNLTMPGSAAPTASANVDQQTLRLDNASNELATLPNNTTGDPYQQLVDQCNQGSIEACSAILETLSQECYQGYGGSCDVLFAVSPLGSDYEMYGATCGYRLSPDIAGRCSEAGQAGQA